MKHKFILLIFIIFATCAFANEGYQILINPEQDNINLDNGTQTLFILDYSNSMNEVLIDKTKHSMLVASMKTILSRMSPSQEVGMRIYGHRWGVTPYDACRASKLIVPIGNDNIDAISENLSKLSPRGLTPITYSLKQAVKNDFKDTTSDKHIILITDGGENCDESPCTYAMELVKYRKDIRIDVITFNLDNEEDLDQLRCVAKVTKGELYNADTYAELVKSLNNAFRSKKHVNAKIVY